MTDLYWPGASRAGDLMTDRSLVHALVKVELGWYAVLVNAGIAPDVTLPTPAELADLSDAELAELATSAESGGNPVIPLLAILRSRLNGAAPHAARWLHRGLTSQDAMDTALMLQLGAVLETVLGEIADQVRVLRNLAVRHRGTLATGRTLTQHAVPITFGLTAANWMSAILDAGTELDAQRRALPAQVGGAAGTLAAITALAGGDDGDPSDQAVQLAEELAVRLGLRTAPSWHTNRRPVTRLGDALVAAADSWAHVANDVLLGSRPEIGELAEGGGLGRGGSSTMPNKQNPILSVLIRRAGLTAPALGASLHTAAAAAVDQRPDGGWHAEWAALRTLARQTVVAASQTTELLTNLVVNEDRMRAIAESAAGDLLAEQHSILELTGASATNPGDPASYLGATYRLIDAAVQRAEAYLEEAA